MKKKPQTRFPFPPGKAKRERTSKKTDLIHVFSAFYTRFEYKLPCPAVPRGMGKQFPEDTKLAFVAALNQTVEVGDHYLYICDVKTMYGDEEKEALFAWNGYGKANAAKEK